MKFTLTATEYRHTAALASIFAVRLLGLFMILPVFSPYAHHLQGATATRIGLALGIYGLSQALLQIPCGMLSDRLGRKLIMTLGLGVFTLGSAIAASSHTIDGVILGRAMQGMGAIGSTIIAFVADVTRDEVRTQAMALIGMSIGSAFVISLVAGPVLNTYIHVNGIFWLCAGLGLLAILLLHTALPTPQQIVVRETAPLRQFWEVLKQPALLRLDFGIFMQHLILTANFVVLPMCLIHMAKFPSAQHWQLYLPVLVISFAGMIPLVIISEKYHRQKMIFLAAIAACFCAQIALWQFHQALLPIACALVVFFIGFNVLEASLPALISRTAPSESKGTAMGIYSSAQFLGIFVGGSLAGFLYAHQLLSGVFLLGAAGTGVWFFVSCFMPRLNPNKKSK